MFVITVRGTNDTFMNGHQGRYLHISRIPTVFPTREAAQRIIDDYEAKNKEYGYQSSSTAIRGIKVI